MEFAAGTKELRALMLYQYDFSTQGILLQIGPVANTPRLI
jgi:hypothetical protein